MMKKHNLCIGVILVAAMMSFILAGCMMIILPIKIVEREQQFYRSLPEMLQGHKSTVWNGINNFSNDLSLQWHKLSYIAVVIGCMNLAGFFLLVFTRKQNAKVNQG